MGVGVPRVDLNHTAKMRDRLLYLIAWTEQDREVEARISVISVELERAPKLGDRRIDPPGGLQQVRIVEPDAIVGGSYLNRPAEMFRGISAIALRQQHAAKIAVGLRIIGRDLQCATELIDRGGRAPGLHILR